MSTPALDAALRSGPNPFEDRVVHSTRRDDVPDAREIHAPVRDRIRRAIDAAATRAHGSFLVIGGQVGRGKTHLLSRIRAESVERGYTFVEIEPLRDGATPLLHVLRHVGAAMRAPDSAPWLVLRTPIERAFYEALLAACAARARTGAVPPHPAIAALFEEARVTSQDTLGVDRFALQCAEAWPQIEQPLRHELLSTPPFRDCDAAILQILFRLPSTRRTDLVSAYLSGDGLAPDELALIGAFDPIDTEDEAMRVLRTILPIGRQAVVLAFDQLESAVQSVGIEAVRRLFITLGDVRDRGGPVVVLASCQTQVWDEVRRGLPQQVQDRVDDELELHAPLREDATALAQVRLASLGQALPHPLHPFAPDVIERIYAENLPPQSPRDLLRRLAARWEQWRAGSQPTAAAPPPPTPAARPATEVIREAIDAQAARLHPRDVPRRSERVRILLEQSLTAAQRTSEPIAGVRVHAATTTRPAPRSSATGMDLVLERDGVRRRVRIEANDEPHGNSPRYGLERLLSALDANTADVGILLRREDRALTSEVQRRLSDRLSTRGGVVYVPERTALRAEANLRVLDLAATGALAEGTIDRATTLRHILQAELPSLDAWARIVERTFGAAAAVPAPPPAAPPPDSAAPADRVLQLLAESRITTEARLSQALKLEGVALTRALEELVARGDVQRLKDQHGNAIVTLSARRA